MLKIDRIAGKKNAAISDRIGEIGVKLYLIA